MFFSRGSRATWPKCGSSGSSGGSSWALSRLLYAFVAYAGPSWSCGRAWSRACGPSRCRPRRRFTRVARGASGTRTRVRASQNTPRQRTLGMFAELPSVSSACFPLPPPRCVSGFVCLLALRTVAPGSRRRCKLSSGRRPLDVRAISGLQGPRVRRAAVCLLGLACGVCLTRHVSGSMVQQAVRCSVVHPVSELAQEIAESG